MAITAITIGLLLTTGLAEAAAPDDAGVLSYAAPAARWHRWGWRVLWVAALAVAAFCTCRWGPGIWHRTQCLYWQRQCLSYTASPDQVVYDEDPANAAKLLAAGGQYLSRVPRPTSSVRYLTTSIKRTTPKTPDQVVDPVVVVPRCWSNLTSSVPLPSLIMGFGGARGTTIFLHELIAPAGTRYLVAVEFAQDLDGFQPQWIQGFNCWATRIVPGTLSRLPAVVPTGYALSVPTYVPRVPPHLRIYAGQVDPADPSHFTIRYELWGKSDTVDGRIDAAGGVTLKQRQVPKEPR